MKGLPRKEEVIKSLIELEKIKGRGITADELGFYIGIDRTNISRYLNQLYKEKRINKKKDDQLYIVVSKVTRMK